MGALEAIGVGKVFDDGFAALTDIHLSVERGEFLTLLGPSGCGKTTLLKTMAGFHVPTTGRVLIGGVDVTDAPPERRDTAMCFQSYALFPHLTVAENIDFGPRQNRVPRSERAERLARLLDQVELEAHRTKLPNKLSGGQQQRVALARALAMQPSVVLFDEPLSNLDAKLRDQVRREIRNLQREFGFTAIYVTHDQAEALAMSDRIVVMREGRIDQIGAPEEVYARPASVFVADFVGAANILPFEPAGDGVVRTRLGPLKVAEPPANDATHICWRPEDAIAGNGADHNVVEGVVTARAYQGAYTEVYVAAGAAAEQRLHLASGAPRVGERMVFHLPPARLRFVHGALS